MKHTPRPWNFSQSPSTRKKLSGIGGFGRWYKSVKNTKSIGGKIIATAWGDTKEEAESNAKLIAAAPELLEQLHLMIMAGQEALDYKDGSGRPILQEAIWRAQDTLKKVMKKS
jgi:hypothetical protein